MIHPASIAVLTDAAGEVCDFAQAARAVMYQKDSGSEKWSPVRTVPVRHSALTPAGIRDDVRALIELLGDCKVIAGREVLGLPFGIFDRMGFFIFTIDGVNGDVLDGIAADIEASDARSRLRARIVSQACPVSTDVPGVYDLDLVLLQTECPEVSSKKAMMGFLRETPFVELRLVCKHTPPWLTGFPVNIAETKGTDGNVRCVITPQTCR